MNEFYSWIQEQMKKREWGTRELARRAGLPHATISRLNHEEAKPGVVVCTGVAKALGLPPVLVFEQAGLLPRRPPDNRDTELLKHIYYELTEDGRRNLVRYAEFLRDSPH